MWQGDAIKALDVPDLHAGPITHACPAATLVVAQRGQQNPQWVVCMFSPADAHIAVCDPQRLPGPEAVVRVADCARMIVKALREGEHHALLLQVRLKDNAKAAKPGVWPAAAHPTDLELQLAVPTTVYHWLQPFHDLQWRGKPDRKSAPRTGKSGCRRTRNATPSGISDPPPRHEPSMRRPRAARWRHTRFHWQACPSTQRRRAPSESRCRFPRRGGPQSRRNAPYVQTSTTQAGQCWNTWRGTRCTPPPRWTTRRRPPPSSKRGHKGSRGIPLYTRRPPPRRPATQKATRRRLERPRELALQPNKDPSPRNWPPWPPCGPRWERAPHTPWPQHTQETWLLQPTQRQCRCGTADSRRTRRTTPYGSSHGTCATASSNQTGPSGTEAVPRTR